MNHSSIVSGRRDFSFFPPAIATLVGRALVPTLVLTLSGWCPSVRAAELVFSAALEQGPQVDTRYDGVLAESYGYHRRSAAPQTIAPPGGAYRYGFPVKTYRWGWFGASHYYPYVVWHRGYNDDCVRWGYRRGY